MSLTFHQNIILEDSLEILKTSRRLLIKGSAGVGKTYMVNELIKKLSGKIPMKRKIYCSAPTNKAVKVIKDKVDKKPNLEFITTHSALKLKRTINFKTGVVTFKPYFSDKYPPLDKVDLFIIDEASMIPTFILNSIEEYASIYDVTVVFIGDEKQINPVGEEESPVFHKGYPTVELTEIVRQEEGNPIIDLSRNLHKIKFKTDDLLENNTKGYLYSNNTTKLIHELAKVNGTDEMKYLSWTNSDVNAINEAVRKEIYGEPRKIEEEETLIFNSPYDLIFFTNEEIKVNSLEVSTDSFKYSYNSRGKLYPSDGEEPKTKIVKLKYYLINESVIVIHEDSEKALKEVLSLMKSKCIERTISWKDFFEFSEQFADLKYNHAITIHKSQGSTYKNAIINFKNINLNKNDKEKKRLMYTAITRASNLLIIYNT